MNFGDFLWQKVMISKYNYYLVSNVSSYRFFLLILCYDYIVFFIVSGICFNVNFLWSVYEHGKKVSYKKILIQHMIVESVLKVLKYWHMSRETGFKPVYPGGLRLKINFWVIINSVFGSLIHRSYITALTDFYSMLKPEFWAVNCYQSVIR